MITWIQSPNKWRAITAYDNAVAGAGAARGDHHHLQQLEIEGAGDEGGWDDDGGERKRRRGRR